ncbi:MAG: hypothetical protein AB1391_03505 [Candidatus Micrarchaeota archaeon]
MTMITRIITTIKKLKRFTTLVFVFAILISVFYAIPMIEPFQKEITNNEEVYLGVIGPGQTISISVDGRPRTGGIWGKGGAYENAVVSGLPLGWSKQDSDWSGVPLQVKITADKFAREGEYKAEIKVLDEGDKERLGNITFFVKINITHNVLDVLLDGANKEVHSGQPAKFYITVMNNANTSDTFSISSSNVQNWTFKKWLYIPARSSRIIPYEIASTEERYYYPLIYVASESSPLINKTLNATVKINPTPSTDFKATNNGMLFFPIISGIIYALAGFFSNFF